jgi:predicted ArsR family transcriptional regulator
MERDRVTVQEAAQRLGISESGVRKRVKREQLDSTNEGGRVYVYLDSAPTEADPVPDSVPDKYVASLEDQVEFLRDQVRRQQEIIGQQALTMRQLTAGEPREARESPTPSPEASEGTTPQPEREEAQEPAQRRPTGVPWWRRIWGG